MVLGVEEEEDEDDAEAPMSLISPRSQQRRCRKKKFLKDERFPRQNDVSMSNPRVFMDFAIEGEQVGR